MLWQFLSSQYADQCMSLLPGLRWTDTDIETSPNDNLPVSSFPVDTSPVDTSPDASLSINTLPIN